MIDERLERMKRKRNCRVYFDVDSFQISDCTVAPVHDIPDVIHENQEFDFYIESTYDVYLLRIIHSPNCIVSIYPANADGIIYIVSSIPVSKNNIKETIQKILHTLEKYGFPKLKNPKSSITLNI
jgi:conserved domain protein